MPKPLKTNANLIEVKVNLPHSVYEWFKERSDQTGVSMKSLYYLAIETYVEQKAIMPLMPQMLKQLQDMEKEEAGQI